MSEVQSLSLSDSLRVIHAHLLGFSSEDLRGELEKEEKGTVAVGAVSACYLPHGEFPPCGRATVSLGSVWVVPSARPPSTSVPAIYSPSLSIPHSAHSRRPRGPVGLWPGAGVPCPLGCLRWGRLVSHLHKPLFPLSPLPNLLRPLLGTGVVCRGEGKQEETEDKGGGSYSCGILGEWDPTPQGGEWGPKPDLAWKESKPAESDCAPSVHRALHRPLSLSTGCSSPAILGPRCTAPQVHSCSPWGLECTSTHFPGLDPASPDGRLSGFFTFSVSSPKCTFSVRPSLAPLVEITVAVLIPLLHF